MVEKTVVGDPVPLRVVGSASALYALGVLVPSIIGLLGPGPVVACATPPCPEPTKDWTALFTGLAGGAILLLCALALVATAGCRPWLSRTIAGVLAAVAAALSALSLIPQLAAIRASRQAGEPVRGDMPELLAPAVLGGGIAIILVLVVALLLSRQQIASRGPRALLVAGAEVIVLLIGLSWFSTGISHALSVIRFRGLDRGLSTAGSPAVTTDQWVLDARAAGLFLFLAVLTPVVLAILALARRRDGQGVLVIAVLAHGMLLVATVISASPLLHLTGWTPLDRTPAWPVSPSALALLLGAALTLTAMGAQRWQNPPAAAAPMPHGS